MVQSDSIMRRLPEIVYEEGTMAAYVEAHDEEWDVLEGEMDEVLRSHQLEHATGDDLDQVGALFGELGKRRGRNDDDYRVYLKSVVRSFNGRGSLTGLKFAIAAAIGTDTSNVVINEDFENLAYTIQIENIDTEFISSAINDLAELADPSTVELLEAIIVVGKGGILVGGNQSAQIASDPGLGANILTLDGTSQLGDGTADYATATDIAFDSGFAG